MRFRKRTITEDASKALVGAGKSIQGSNLLGDTVGDFLIDRGVFIYATTNLIGDAVDAAEEVVGKGADTRKRILASKTNLIYSALKRIWGWFN